MNKQKLKQEKIERRHKKIRIKIIGTATRPRLNVFRSNKGMYLQLIDDAKAVTIASASISEIKAEKKTKTEVAKELGLLIAKKAADSKIDTVVFDRGGLRYHGRVKAAAEGAREGGLKF
ncbi:MAG: 50S ribosomal protein L18 [Candidatus Falkowbacteria bacterium]